MIGETRGQGNQDSPAQGPANSLRDSVNVLLKMKCLLGTVRQDFRCQLMARCPCCWQGGFPSAATTGLLKLQSKHIYPMIGLPDMQDSFFDLCWVALAPLPAVPYVWSATMSASSLHRAAATLSPRPRENVAARSNELTDSSVSYVTYRTIRTQRSLSSSARPADGLSSLLSSSRSGGHAVSEDGESL